MAYTAPDEKRYAVPVPELDLRLVARGSTVAEMLEFNRLTRRMFDEGRTFITDAVEYMLPKLVEWNRPEPLALDSLLRLFDFEDLFTILKAYTAVVIGVADPLVPPSGNGVPSPEVNEQTEALLASLSS